MAPPMGSPFQIGFNLPSLSYLVVRFVRLPTAQPTANSSQALEINLTFKCTSLRVMILSHMYMLPRICLVRGCERRRIKRENAKMTETDDIIEPTWQRRVAPHLPVFEALKLELHGSETLIGALERNATFGDRVWEALEFQPSARQKAKRAAIHASYYAVLTISSLCGNCAHRWENGDFVSFCLNARLIFEYAAAVYYIRTILFTAENCGDWDSASEKCLRIIAGSRRPYWLKVYGIEQPQSLNVLTMIKKWRSENADGEDDYAFLSEACHPNHLHHYYLFKAGKDGNQGMSLISEPQVEQALHRVIVILQKAVENISKSLAEIADQASDWSKNEASR